MASGWPYFILVLTGLISPDGLWTGRQSQQAVAITVRPDDLFRPSGDMSKHHLLGTDVETSAVVRPWLSPANAGPSPGPGRDPSEANAEMSGIGSEMIRPWSRRKDCVSFSVGVAQRAIE